MKDIEFIKYGDPLEGCRAGVKASNLAIAINVLTQIKLLAPVYPKSKDKNGNPIIPDHVGGQLRNSYMYVTPDKEGGLNDHSGMKAEKGISVRPKEFEAYVGSALDYAVYQEFGTRKMDAQPHFRPAIDIVVKGAAVQDVIKACNEQMYAHVKRTNV